MENIKFIKEFAKHIKREHTIVGHCVYFKVAGNLVKTYAEQYGVIIEVINPVHGPIDKIRVPFSCYFAPVQCSPRDSFWTQTIDGGEWRFKQYPHTQPKESDYKAVAMAMEDYMKLFE